MPKKTSISRELAEFFTTLGDRVSPTQAELLGVPEAIGMSRDNLKLLLEQKEERPKREHEAALRPIQKEKALQEISSSKTVEKQRISRIAALEKTRNAALKQIGQLTPSQLLQHERFLVNQTQGVEGMMLRSTDPEGYSDLVDQLSEVRKRTGLSPKGLGGGNKLPNATGGGLIRVRLKNGKTGTLLEKDFDAATMTKL